jgi:hypothetical protein
MTRILLFLFSTALLATAQPKSLFYMIDTPGSVKSFTEHADKIDILVPAWYSVDGNGLVSGGPNPNVLTVAADHHVPVMPIVALMVQLDLHKLMVTPVAQQAFINALVRKCELDRP